VPMMPVGEIARPEDNTPEDGADCSGLAILLAEDNEANQLIALGMLRKLGCRAVVANNGREAIDHAVRTRFDVILMDCQMPEVDGYEATEALRALEKGLGRPRTPIIALTANALSSDRSRCLDAGMDDHVSKPYSLAILRSTLLRWSRVHA